MTERSGWSELYCGSASSICVRSRFHRASKAIRPRKTIIVEQWWGPSEDPIVHSFDVHMKSDEEMGRDKASAGNHNHHSECVSLYFLRSNNDSGKILNSLRTGINRINTCWKIACVFHDRIFWEIPWLKNSCLFYVISWNLSFYYWAANRIRMYWKFKFGALSRT